MIHGGLEGDFKEFWARSGLMEDFYLRPHGHLSKLLDSQSIPPLFLVGVWCIDGRYYLIGASLGGTTCPLAMTDGAAGC